MPTPVLASSGAVVVLAFSSTSPGALSVTVPSDATHVMVGWEYIEFDGGGPGLTSLGCSFANFAGNLIEQAGDFGAAGVGWAEVTATGSQTITPVWSTPGSDGPNLTLVFVKDVDSGSPVNGTDVDASITYFDRNAAATVPSDANALVVAYDVALNGSAPANETGWTSQGTGSNGGVACRVRTISGDSGPTVTANTQFLQWNAIGAVSFNGGSGGGTTHDSSGSLVGPGSTVAGSAQHNVPHPSSGALTGPGSTVSGTAARTRAHASSGALTGPGSTVAGTAARTRQHPSSGVLTGPGSEIAGTAARTRQHAGSGDLVGPGSTVVGSADHQAAAGVHEASGALVGQGSTVAGAAARFRAFAASGALVGQGAEVAGSANHIGPAVSHDATGVLVGPGSVVTGFALNGQTETEYLGGAPTGRKKKRYVRTELDKDSYLYRLLSPEVREKLEPEVAEVIEAKAVEVVEQKAKPSPKAVRTALADEGIAYKQAYKEIYLELIGEIRRAREDEEEEEEEEAIAMALLL